MIIFAIIILVENFLWIFCQFYMKSKKISLLFTICYINSCNKNCGILFGLKIFVCFLISFPLCFFLGKKSVCKFLEGNGITLLKFLF